MENPVEKCKIPLNWLSELRKNRLKQVRLPEIGEKRNLQLV